jgi:transposase
MGLIVGIDLGIKSDHDAIIIRRETSKTIGKGIRFSNTCDGREALFERVSKLRDGEERVDFVIDSPGRAWMPLTALLKSKGFAVYRPTAVRVSKMRQAGDRNNKTNRIDALALAKCLLNFPDETEEVFLATGIQCTLDQLVRQRDRVVDLVRRRKQRIQDQTIAINPTLMKAMGDFALSQGGRAFLRTYLDPRKVVRTGLKRLMRFLDKHYRQDVKPELVEAIFNACKDAASFYDPIREQGFMPVDEICLQEEMNWELDRLESDEQRLLNLEKQIEKINQKLDPSDSFISIPGVRHILAGSIRSCIGDIDRFNTLTKHRGFVGFYPNSKGTGDNRATGTRMSKMASGRYRKYLYMAAENAYRWDVEMADYYHRRRRGGHNHTQAVCAVANAKLLPRIHHLLKELKQAKPNQVRPQYVFRDLSGNPISKAEAKAIINDKWKGQKYEK